MNSMFKFPDYHNYSRSVEKSRYDLKAKTFDSRQILSLSNSIYRSSSTTDFESPFIFAKSLMLPLLTSSSIGLDLGCGTGLHSIEFSRYFKKLFAVDISTFSLELLSSLDYPNIYPLNASIDNIPLPDSSVDIVLSFGSISYADPSLIFDEVKRIVRPNGYFLIVDTLSGNPFYSLNRFLHIIRGTRSFLQTFRLLSLSDIQQLTAHSKVHSLQFFGKYLWLSRILPAFIVRTRQYTSVISFLERYTPNCFAFKYLILLQF